jgi:hypothetical protein
VTRESVKSLRAVICKEVRNAGQTASADSRPNDSGYLERFTFDSSRAKCANFSLVVGQSGLQTWRSNSLSCLGLELNREAVKE